MTTYNPYYFSINYLIPVSLIGIITQEKCDAHSHEHISTEKTNKKNTKKLIWDFVHFKWVLHSHISILGCKDGNRSYAGQKWSTVIQMHPSHSEWCDLRRVSNHFIDTIPKPVNTAHRRTNFVKNNMIGLHTVLYNTSILSEVYSSTVRSNFIPPQDSVWS